MLIGLKGTESSTGINSLGVVTYKPNCDAMKDDDADSQANEFSNGFIPEDSVKSDGTF